MTVARPGPAFAYSHPAHVIALGFGVGLAPIAPGTFGTLLAFPIWWAIAALLPPLGTLAVIAALFILGVWACDATGRDLGDPDHGAMVWDEVVAFLTVLAVLPPSAGWALAGFVVFRLFDIAKPPPIRLLERRVAGGMGVMLDDLLAAGYTLLVLAVARRVFF